MGEGVTRSVYHADLKQKGEGVGGGGGKRRMGEGVTRSVDHASLKQKGEGVGVWGGVGRGMGEGVTSSVYHSDLKEKGEWRGEGGWEEEDGGRRESFTTAEQLAFALSFTSQLINSILSNYFAEQTSFKLFVGWSLFPKSSPEHNEFTMYID